MTIKIVNVLHLIDTLEIGGAERLAINLANWLPQDRYKSHLGTTRRDGALGKTVNTYVSRLSLNRRKRFDFRAFRNLKTYVKEHNIQILHAHNSSLFIANIASFFPPYPLIIWHVHTGRYASENSVASPYRLISKRAGAVITVNQALSDWAKRRLHIPSDKIWYLPNFVDIQEQNQFELILPGSCGFRLVCLANLRREKDHLTLIKALKIVAEYCPQVHLILVGAQSDSATVRQIKDEITRLQLEQYVSLFGQREDAFDILQHCDIGVLSSISEGLPMALLEYGLAGLPVVTTNVGQCADVLDYGRAGLVVPPQVPQKLAEALILLLNSPERRRQFGAVLQQRIAQFHSPAAVLGQLDHIYTTVLSQR